jgi:hypothetical protein
MKIHGNTIVTSTEDSTGSGTGSIQTPGGLYVAKSVYVAGGLRLPTGTPTVTTDKLYNVSGALYFNGSALGGSSGAGITTIAYASTININMTTITTLAARITLTGPCTINFTGGSDGQKLTLELLQDGTGGRVVTLGTGIGYGADILSYSGNTTLNKRDILGFHYNSSTSKAFLIAVAKGY